MRDGMMRGDEGPVVLILCRDRRLGNGLRLSMAERGLSPVWTSPDEELQDGLPGLPVLYRLSRLMDERRAVLLLGDADDCPDLLTLPSGFPAVVWTRAEVPAAADMTPPVTLHRPLDDLLLDRAVTACLAGESAAMEKAPAPDKAPAADPPLTPHERVILGYLAAHRGETVTRETLRALIGESPDARGNMVDVYVSRLRAKLEKPAGVRIIETVRGAGYRML
ncbi:MAG: winged helix-turn-helix domain-containing protein [Clostridia bacterium]|nr:winged helix-turn-helix domain-containing protein [Clostridia bacterium]